MKLPNSLFRLLGGLLVLFLLSSCSSAWYMASNNYNNDPIYGVVESTGDTIKIDVISNDFQLDRKFRFDDKFRWNFAQYAMNQDLRWHYDFYWNNRMYRSPFASPFDFYWNSNQYWWNWSSNYPFNYGFNHWDRFGFYGYGYWNDPFRFGNSWAWGYKPNRWFNYNQGIAYNFRRENQNISYNIGRRGSNGVVVTPNGSSRGNSNSNLNINRGRNSKDIVLPRNYRDIGVKPNPDNIDVVIEQPNRTRLGRLIEKIENASGVRVRTYENPNNVPNNNRIRNYNRVENGNNVNRNNNNNIRNYNRPPVNNNSRPSRNYSPPSRSSSPPVINRGSSRSSNPPVISRSSGGSRGSVKN